MSVRYAQLIKKATELKTQGDTQGARLIIDGIKYLAEYYAGMAKMGVDILFRDRRTGRAALERERRKNENAFAWAYGVYEVFDEGSEAYEKARAVDAVFSAAGLDEDVDPFDVAKDICDQLTQSSIIEHAAIEYGKKHDYSLDGFVWEGDEDLVEMGMEEVKLYLEWMREKGE